MTGFDQLATEDLVVAYRDLGALIRAAEAQRLAILAVLDRREAWRADGCLDVAQWVAATDAVPAAAARVTVATAHSLAELPAVAAAAAEGRLSMAQLVPLAVVAEPATDERWAADGPGMTPAALAQLATQHRRVEREEAERQHRRRSFRWWRDRHGLGVRFAGLLPDAEATVVTGAVERLAEQAPRAEDGTFEPHESRCADALVAIAGGEVVVPELVVHVPVGIAGQPQVEGTPVSIDSVHRLSCDATARLLVENPDGTVAGYGRRWRIVPKRLRQRLEHRDGGCVWRGCGRRRGLHAHHVRHWTDGGATEEENLALLCTRHHHLVHEGGWQLTGRPGAWEHRRPSGGVVSPAAPPPARPDLLARYGLAAA
jgi:hypothetical protein